VKGPSNSSETSVNTTPSDFDELTYLEYNPDVRAAVMQGAISCGYEHWIEHGQQEGRLSSTRAQPAQGNAPPDWNELRYLRNNPDVAAAVRTGIYSSGYDHWIQHGEQEARIGAAGRVFHKTTDLKTALRKHPPGFNYFSFQSVAIGLGWAARGYIGLLKAFGPKVTTIDLAWGGAPSDGPAGVAATPKNPYAINFFHFNPDILPNFLHQYGAKCFLDRYNIGVWVWDLNAAYPSWHRYTRMFNEIWVPSQFVADAVRVISTAPIVIVPHVVDDLPARIRSTRATFGFPENAFIFLYVFDAASSIERKNPLALISAFRQAFSEEQNVVLVLKYHHADKERPAVELLERIASTRKNIRTISQTLSEEDLGSLFQISDCFVSPHRSEGFGLNIAMAMYYGKPVIVTGYSGNMDFTNSENSFLIDYHLVGLPHDIGYYKAGYGWAQPSVDHLASLLQAVLGSPEEARRKAANGAATIRQRLSHKALLERFGKRISALKMKRLVGSV
jgi:glycosyltransferase involved in cell wall biosynthesis